ncbi:MAG: hypothetical protein LUE22_08035 [Oscillospiraceae bacterium]|nr:hypothetical protein [Oscillospiraceae bacterium]
MNQSLQALYNEKKRTIGEILSTIRSGDVIFTTNNYSEPGEILSHLHEIAPQVEDVKVWKGRSGLYPFMVDPGMKGHIEMYTYFFFLRPHVLPQLQAHGAGGLCAGGFGQLFHRGGVRPSGQREHCRRHAHG